jgi:uncharacterized protein
VALLQAVFICLIRKSEAGIGRFIFMAYYPAIKFPYLCAMNIVEKNSKRIKELCEQYKVSKLFVFGSVTTDRFNSESDIDFIVDFRNVDLYDYANNYYDFKYSLESIFNRTIDLLEDTAIKNPYLRASIDSSKQLIYG